MPMFEAKFSNTIYCVREFEAENEDEAYRLAEIVKDNAYSIEGIQKCGEKSLQGVDTTFEEEECEGWEVDEVTEANS
tara:strand:+ start:637 stop:867 length:231 start_codon:yes stop_codon:yes gene_type:complete